MNKLNNKIKYIAIAVAIILSVAGYAAVGGKEGLPNVGNSTATNIAIVTKEALKYPDETAGVHMWGQNFCVTLKKGFAEQNGIQYTPSPEETLTREQVIALFNEVKIEEYYKGTSYARIETGRKVDFSNFIDQNKQNIDKSNFNIFNCKYPLVPYTYIQIEKQDKKIQVLTTKEGGTVDILNISKELQKYQTKETPFDYPETVNVGNTKYKCVLTPFMFCYLHGMQVHPGTGKHVLVQILRPKPGGKADDPLSPEQDKLYSEFNGTLRGSGAVKILENISITVGEPISDDKFEIPTFAKNFKTKIE